MQTFPGNGGEHEVTVESGDIVENIDFGNQEIEPASVHGAKWSDSNGDGLRQDDEPGLPGVTIYADLNDNGVFDEDEPNTTTMEDDPETDFDETGHYWLEGLRPGAKVIREVVPDGFMQTFPTDPDAHLVELASGEVVEGLDFGNALEGHKLSLCHNGHSINVDFHSLPAHLMHGDWVAVDENACGR